MGKTDQLLLELREDFLALKETSKEVEQQLGQRNAELQTALECASEVEGSLRVSFPVV